MWRKAYSKEKPLEAEQLNSDNYLIRQNITEVISTDTDGNEVTSYEYEEKIVSETEYNIMETVNNIEIKREQEILDKYTAELMEEGVLE